MRHSNDPLDEQGVTELLRTIEPPPTLAGSWHRRAPVAVPVRRHRLRLTVSAAAAGVLAVVGGIAVAGQLVLGPTPTPTPPPTQSAPVPAESSSPTPSPSPQPTGAAWPDETNTGVPAGITLRNHTGDLVIDQPNTVVSGLVVHGTVYVRADNVTIKQSKVLPQQGFWAIQQVKGFRNLVVERTEIAAATPSRRIQYGIRQDGVGLQVRGCHIHHVDVGVGAGVDTTVTGSYIHDLTSPDSSFAVLASGGNQKLRVTGNVLLNPTRDGAAVGLFTDYGPQRDVLIDGNLLAGGGYVIYSGASDARDIRITSNAFSRRYYNAGGRYGVVDRWPNGVPGNQWSGNRWLETSAALPEPSR